METDNRQAEFRQRRAATSLHEHTVPFCRQAANGVFKVFGVAAALQKCTIRPIPGIGIIGIKWEINDLQKKKLEIHNLIEKFTAKCPHPNSSLFRESQANGLPDMSKNKGPS